MKPHLPITFLIALLGCFVVNAVEYNGLDNLSFVSQSSSTNGGAISDSNIDITGINDYDSSIIDVYFYGNRADASQTISGGALYASQRVNINNNADIDFTKNSVSVSGWNGPASGGAIASGNGIYLKNNQAVSFSSNEAVTYSSSSTGDSASGGALYSNNTILLDSNSNVKLSNNNAYSSGGGYGYFGGNANGGAVYSSTSIGIVNTKKDVIILSNYAYSHNNNAYGGALYSNGNITISNNSTVKISGNYTEKWGSRTSSDVACGGAIFAKGSMRINGNEEVIFTLNHVIDSSEYYGSKPNSRGGAIYTTGSIVIVDNNSVSFQKNYEKIAYSASCLLRSIYMDTDSSSDSLTLAARSGGHISFYDSLYMGHYAGAVVNLNADYEDKYGNTQKATGDIVFSGKYTEEHLKSVKVTAGTATEIANSRTSELLNTVNLYGGTLRVEDKAVLKTHAINVTDGSNATMKVADAKVNASGYNITVNKTGTLEIAGTDGSSKITAKNINIEEGATLSLTRTEVVTENIAITLSSTDSVSIYNDKIAGIVSSSNLNIAAGATLKADGAHLSMDGGILSFLATTENKTNLVLTLGAEYDPNSQIILFSDVNTVKFLQDNITATTNSAMVTLNASDYFIGDWVNDKTILVYDSGNIYVSGVNVVIPEPATTTLSLLALAALAARRRRK